MTAFGFSSSATVLQHLTGWPIEAAIVAVATITVVYTFVGGMKAVIWTDVIQFSVYIIGAVVALSILVSHLPGGWTELIRTAAEGHKFRLFDFSFDLTRNYTFWSGLIGGMVLNTATHGADQMMVQRYLAARSKGQAALALVASGFVILAQFALFLFIGVSLWVFYRSFPPTGLSVRSDEAFTYFIIKYLPTGVLRLGDRGDLLGGDGHAGRFAQLIRIDDRQRPLPALYRPERRTASDESRASNDHSLGISPDVGRPWCTLLKRQRRDQRLDGCLFRLRHPARVISARNLDQPCRTDSVIGRE